MKWKITVPVFLATIVIIIVWNIVAASPPPCFVLITVDTLRADRLGCYGNTWNGRSPSPVADALAAEGFLFERFTTPRGQTHPSLASMFFGKYPITHGLRENIHKPHPDQLSFVEILRREGYLTAGFSANMKARTLKNPRPAWWTQGFDESGDGYGGDPLGETHKPLQDQFGWDDRVEEQAIDWIGRLAHHNEEGGKPFFLWVHFFDVHKPYLPHESCPDFLPGYAGPLALPDPAMKKTDPAGYDRITPALDAAALTGSPLAADDHEYVLACYDAGIAGVDARVGRILDELAKQDLMENTWVFYSSDHGDELGDHNNYYYHGTSIYESVLHIPLIVRPPAPDGRPLAAAGSRSPALLQNIDLAPTLLCLAGFEPPTEMEGFSFLPILKGKRKTAGRKLAFAEWQDLIYSVNDGKTKYICNPKGACPVKPPWTAGAVGPAGAGFLSDFDELYDLAADRREQRNIAAGEKRAVSAMRLALRAWLRDPARGGGFDTEKELSREEIQFFKSLGYVGTDPKRQDVRFRKKQR